MSLTKLACQRVQDLTPYLSARRIGGKGHVVDPGPLGAGQKVVVGGGLHGQSWMRRKLR